MGGGPPTLGVDDGSKFMFRPSLQGESAVQERVSETTIVQKEVSGRGDRTGDLGADARLSDGTASKNELAP